MSKLDLIKKQIKNLSPKEQACLFDKLSDSIEDYLLTKIAENRLKSTINKRVPWSNLTR